MSTPLTYEHPWLVAREPDLNFPAAFFLQGAALAFMQLIERVDWCARPSLTQSFYEKLFRGGTPWRVEQTQGIRAGDRVCEVVVSRST